MALTKTDLIQYQCDQCGHTFTRYKDIKHVAECAKCAQSLPGDFDYPLLEKIVRYNVELILDDAVTLLHESIDGCMDEIMSEMRFQLREKQPPTE